MGTKEYLDPNQKTYIHYVTNMGEEGNEESIKARGKHEGQTSKPTRAVVETEHWVVMGCNG